MQQLCSRLELVHERLDRKVDAIQADCAAMRQKYDALVEENSALTKSQLELLQENKALSAQVSALSAEATRLTVPVKKGIVGEAQLLGLLAEIVGEWGLVTDTHKLKHSGDIVLQTMDDPPFRILLDRKNYDVRHIHKYHLDNAVRDAMHQQAHAVIVVYNALTDKYKSGLCQDDDVVSHFSGGFDHRLVLACTLQSLERGLISLLLKRHVSAAQARVSREEAVQVGADMRLSRDLLALMFARFGPLLDAMKLREIKAGADELQSMIVRCKRVLSAPPYVEQKEPFLRVLNLFEEGRRAEHVLGGNLSAGVAELLQDETGSTEPCAKRQKPGDQDA